MSASISSKRAMANAMVPTVDDGGRMVGSRMAMRMKARFKAFFRSFGGFGRRLAAREDPFGGGDIVRLIVVVVVSSSTVWVRSVRWLHSFSKIRI